MKNIALMAAALLFSSALQAADSAADAGKATDPLQNLLQQVGQYQQNEKSAGRQREQAFRSDLAQQKRMLAEAQAQLKAEQQRADRLKKQFDQNEKSLTDREEELRLRVGNLGEMFGVVRQTATDLSTLLSDSLTSVQQPERRADLNKLAEAKELPTIRSLEDLWYTLQEEMILNGQVAAFDTQVIAADGSSAQRHVTRLGVFNTVEDNGYLAFDTELKSLQELGRQPAQADMIHGYLHSTDGVAPVAIDPSRGALLNLTLESPDLLERIQQGALVGYIILLLGVIGLALAGWRTLVLLGISRAINRQKANLTSPATDNPLGRVLQTWRDLPKPADVDVVEAKMDEAVLKELPALERGQTIIKLFAGIAPLLGLLGTVTGMIATFQAITNFGTGDPKLMAAGISQALITTVLGLVVAIPLLLAHSWVAARSKALIQLLDEQSAGLMAAALEQQHSASRGTDA